MPRDPPALRRCKGGIREARYSAAVTVGAVAGARCAVHPEQFAAGVCDRCGSFYCPSCVGRIEGERSTCAACEAATAHVAWERRDDLGTMKAFWQTLKRSVLHPLEFAREIPAEGGFGGPTAYALLASAIGAIPILAMVGLMFVFFLAVMPAPGMSGPDAPPGWIWAIVAVFYAIVFSLGPVGWTFLWAGILRLSSRILGAPRGSYVAIFRILAYSAGTNVAIGVPVAGTAVYVLQAIHAIFGISHKCGVSNGRAAAIYFVPLLACMCCAGGSYAGLIAFAMSVAPPAQPVP